VIRHELAYEGLSVIIARRACVTYAKEIKALKAGKGGDCALAEP
jgi:TPP-dependent indolepyruvate ferredoxin oxidoreductase alpha subunit